MLKTDLYSDIKSEDSEAIQRTLLKSCLVHTVIRTDSIRLIVCIKYLQGCSKRYRILAIIVCVLYDISREKILLMANNQFT